MKRVFLVCLLSTACLMLFGAGIVVNSILSPLINTTAKRCMYDVSVENQVAVVTVTEVFVNNYSSSIAPRYYYPLPEGASATKLRWSWNGAWLEANVTGGGGSGSGVTQLPQLYQNYLGANPLKFDFNTALLVGDSLKIELTYVQMLSYAFGNVELMLRNNSSYIQSNTPLLTQSLQVSLNSVRTITSISLESHYGEYVSNNGHEAFISYQALNQYANTNYKVIYSLSSEELGLWSMSTMTTNPPDNFGHGFFSFVVEPEPSDTIQVINKVFTLILDRSGSMYGTKFQQAQAAATYIVNHLNPGDLFNIISFSTDVTPLWMEHMPYNPSNANTAFNYINGLYANGSTNISGVFSTAIPQFGAASNQTANIVIFLTDGQATVGILDTSGIVSHVDNLVNQTETGIFLFTFGIGSDVNPQLLSLLAQHHSGLATFLGDNDLNQTITEFYNSIQNPVLLNPVFTVNPPNAVHEVYPYALPNLYLGKQLIVSGRYDTPQTASITFSGQAFNQHISYQYPLYLREDSVSTFSFLPKLWAKQKIEKLLIDYYLLNPNSSAALELKQDIISISIAYGVVCVFTQFSGGTADEDDVITPLPSDVRLLGNYPNPFSQQTSIKFEVLKNMQSPAILKIYNIKGELVRVIALNVRSKGIYNLVWDGKNKSGKDVPNGIYCYTLSLDNTVLAGKLSLLR